MRAGRLRDVATFERQSTIQDEFGQRPDAWTNPNGTTVHCAVEPLRGNEYIAASGERAEITTRIRVRYSSLTNWVRSRDRIRVGGYTYDIRSVIDTDNRRKELQLMCILVVDD